MTRFAVFTAAALAAALNFGSAPAQDVTTVWDIARGGQLYDNWIAVVDADKPEATHPAYPASSKKSGASTLSLIHI